MIEKVKKELEDITNEVNELHPLLHELFNRHPKITRTEYTHGTEEMGADFVLTRTDNILETTEHIGIVAKCGKIHLKLDDVERQIEECTTIPRKIDGGKKQIVLSQVWVVATGTITKGAQDKIHAKYPGTNVHFINLDHLASLVDQFVPYYLSNVDLRISSYLQDLKAHSEELDKNLDLIQLEGEPLYINQEILRTEVEPYRTGQRRKREKPKRIDLMKEIPNNKLLLLEAGMGGGKSKLLRRLTQSYAELTTFADEKILPIHVTFKELVDVYSNDLTKLLQAKVPGEVRETVKNQVKYLFLVDAVDEKALPPEQLTETLATLADEVKAHDGYHLLLASRHADSLDVDRKFLNRFTRYEVAALSMGKIVSFLDTICRRLNLHSRIVEDLQRSVLFDRLPRNPIAAVLLGQLLKEKQQELPSTMTELYQKYMETVLGRWDIEKGLQSQQEFDTLENVLQDLATYMLDHQLETISLEEVKGRFHSYLSERNLKVEVQQLVERAVHRADVLAMSRDEHSVWFKHRSFAEFLYAKRLVKMGELQSDVRAFEVYWANTYFFCLGLKKDAPELLESLVTLPVHTDMHRWMKLFALGDLLMAAYGTPYRVIQKGVYQATFEAAELFKDAAEGKISSPFAGLAHMHLLYFIQLIVRDNYGYEFLAPALEDAATKLIGGEEDEQLRAYAVFLISVAYIDAGHGETSFEWLLEEFKGRLPLDLRLAVLHEGDDLKARSKAIKRLRSNIATASRGNQSFQSQVKQLYEQPTKLPKPEIP